MTHDHEPDCRDDLIMSQKRKVWSREDLLRAAGIKPVEWPEGWYLWAAPHYMVSPMKEPQRKRFKR